MDFLNHLEKLIYDMYDSTDSETKQGSATELANWLIEATGDQIVECAISFLNSNKRECILFFAANSLKQCIRTKWNQLTQQILSQLVSFFSQYIINHQTSISQPSYVFIIICLTDMAILAGETFPFPQVLSDFPINIQMTACLYYFDEFNSGFFKGHFSQDPIVAPRHIIEYAHHILQNTPLSLEWLKFYHNFTYSLIEYESILIYVPVLQEAATILDLCDVLSSHIKMIIKFDMHNGPDAYHFALIEISIRLSIALRAAISENPRNFSLTDKLLILWTNVLDLEDSEGFYVKIQLPLMIELIQEFQKAEEILVRSYQLSGDNELWPGLIETLITFGETLSNDNPLQQFSVNFMEFVLIGLQFGVDITQIKDKLPIFYGEAKNLLDSFFASPTVNYPTILLVIGVLCNSNNNHNHKLPDEIVEQYFLNIDKIDAPPWIQIYFAEQSIEQYGPKFGVGMVSLFCQFFEMFPYECSRGIFHVLKYHPQFVPLDLIVPLNQRMTMEPNLYENDYLIPTLVTLLISIPQDQADQYYVSLYQVFIHNFIKINQETEECRQDIKTYFSNLDGIFKNLFTLSREWSFTGSICLFQMFGQKVFADISTALGGIWLDPDESMQKYLTTFAKNFLIMRLVENPAVVAQWLNQVISMQPYSFHLSLLPCLKEQIPLLPNIPQLIAQIQLQPAEIKNGFLYELFESLLSMIPQWNDVFWIVFPSEILFEQILKCTDVPLMRLALTAITDFVNSKLISHEFKMQSLQIFAQGFFNCYTQSSVTQLSTLILSLAMNLGPQNVTDVFANALSLNEEASREFFQILTMVPTDVENEQKEALRNFFIKIHA